jgi:hypothetical protein
MPEQTRSDRDSTMPNRAANKEPAEGSRENVGASEDAGGITNRPLKEEEDEQEQVPPRGQNKEGGHA